MNKRVSVLIGGIILFLIGLIMYITISIGNYSFPFFNKGTALTIIFTAIFYTLFGLLLIKNGKSTKAKQFIIPFIICIFVSLLLFVATGYTILFRILLLSIWLIGGVFVLVNILKKKKDINET